MRFIVQCMAWSLVATSLTGCVFSGGLESKITKSKENRFAINENKTDRIIAVGKPVKPVTTHPYALVLAGQKYNYLIESLDNNDQKSREILAIFEQLPSQYLTLSTSIYQSENADFFSVRPEGGRYQCPSQYGCMQVVLKFNKPKNLVKINDESQLKALGFSCDKITEKLTCTNGIKMAVTPITKSDNQKNANLTYRFRQPITMKFYDFHPSKGALKRGVLTALIPLAVVVDIVTFPVQAEFKKVDF